MVLEQIFPVRLFQNVCERIIILIGHFRHIATTDFDSRMTPSGNIGHKKNTSVARLHSSPDVVRTCTLEGLPTQLCIFWFSHAFQPYFSRRDSSETFACRIAHRDCHQHETRFSLLQKDREPNKHTN